MMNLMPIKNIVCFGEVLWDMIPAGAEPGGAPANVAIHLKRQGLDPMLVSCVGNDDEGEALKDFLSGAGLSLRYLQENAGLPTSKVLVHIDKDKNARYEICEPVAWDGIRYSSELGLLAREADLIVFGTLASRSRETRSTLHRMLEQSEAAKLLDVNLRPPFDNRELVESFIHLADFVKLNDDELKQVAKWNSRSGSEEELTGWLAEHYGCATVCVTRGAAGALLFMDNNFFEHPGFKVQAVDTVGAGDAFLAALIAGFSKTSSPEYALAYASATGAYVASCRGAVPVYSSAEIEAMFHI